MRKKQSKQINKTHKQNGGARKQASKANEGAMKQARHSKQEMARNNKN